MSRFFCNRDTCMLAYPMTLTICFKYDKESDSIKSVCLETLNDPLIALSFDDFKIQKLLDHGINYKALNITGNLNLGHDKEFTELAKRFANLESDMYKKTEN